MNIGHKINNMSTTSEYDYIINSLVEEVDAYIDHKISWQVNNKLLHPKYIFFTL